MRISHEAIYQSLYVQGRGALRRELTACLRTGRALRVPRLAPTSKACRISRAIRLRPCCSPCPRSSACTRGAPYVWRELACTVRTRFSNAASATACAEGGRLTQV